MDDHKLRVFCTVAETKSFSKASSIIHLTQPAVSLQVQALEEIYETKLFDRSNNTVTLTTSGHVLYKYAKEILGLYASVGKDIGGITGLVKGSLTVGASSTIANYVLPSVISDFSKEHPKTRINLLVGNTRKVVEMLNAGSIDVGLVEGDISRQKIVSETLVPDELILVMPPSHPWAGRLEIPLSEFARAPFITREEGSGTRQMIEKHLSKHGLTPQNMNISLILGSTEAIKAAVENCMGVSLLSRWAVRKEIESGQLSAGRIQKVMVERNFSVVHSKNSYFSHMFETFLQFVKAYPFDDLLAGKRACSLCA